MFLCDVLFTFNNRSKYLPNLVVIRLVQYLDENVIIMTIQKYLI